MIEHARGHRAGQSRAAGVALQRELYLAGWPLVVIGLVRSPFVTLDSPDGPSAGAATVPVGSTRCAPHSLRSTRSPARAAWMVEPAQIGDDRRNHDPER